MGLPPIEPGRQRFSVYHRSYTETDLRNWHLAYANAFSGCTRVLDFGCGTGLFLQMLRERGVPELLGIDRDPDMVAQTHARNLDAVVGDASQVEQFAGEFDGIHASHVLETMWGDDVLAFLRAAKNALRPDGLLVLRAWNWENPAVRDRTFWFEITHKRPYSLVTLRTALMDLGMQVVAAGYEPDGAQDVYVVARSPAVTPVAPRPERHEKPIVVWEGELQTLNSMAIVNRELGRILAASDDLQILFRPDEIQPEPFVSADARYDAVRARIQRMPVASDVFVRHPCGEPNFERPATGTYVQIQPWEYGSLPAAWVEKMKKNVDEVWCPSSYVRTLYVEAGFDPERVLVVPNGIDPQMFSPGEPDRSQLPLLTQKRFAFLYVGGTLERKGIDVLLSAYVQAFEPADDVALVIKDFGLSGFYRMVSYREKILELKAKPGVPEIVYTDADLTPAQLIALYRSCQCFAFPYRGEGFGIPILEAMACGLPVVVTAGGAADDFLDDATAYRIPSSRRSIGKRVYEVNLADEGWLLEPDRDALAATLRKIYDDPDAAREVGRRASARARNDFTWECAAQRVIARVSALRQAPPIPAAG